MIIISAYKNEKNAGLKAPIDIIHIINKNDKSKNVKLNENAGKFKKICNWLMIKKYRFYRKCIFVQYPSTFKFNPYKYFISKRKIILLHDIEGLRKKNSNILSREMIGFKNFEYIICHNKRMKEYLIENGIDEGRIKILELFDYLVTGNVKEKQNKIIEKPIIIYAGNLIKEKSPFLHQIDKEKINFNFNLYGVGVSNDINEKMKYKGSFEPDILPNKLEGDLGLVWDGNYDESDENEGFKNYTKYNNPHKLSCYIAAGLPVIVWRKAAISDLVKKYNIGYTISNIYDINNIDFSDYNEKLKNVKDLSKKVRSGYFTKRVMKEIFNDMGVNENEI